MEKGYLSQYFEGVAAKMLSVVEADSDKSNQHEFNGVRMLKDIFGAPEGKLQIPTQFLYLNDESEPIDSKGFLTWYDAREKHPSRTEWRLYYSSNDVSRYMAAEDSLFICKRKDSSALLIVAQSGSSIESQLIWLFGFDIPSKGDFSIKQEEELDQNQLFFGSRLVLDQLGIEMQDYAQEYLEGMLNRFNGTLPKTRIFSEFARSTIKFLSPIEDPDRTLLEWIDREELLFRTMEKYLISQRLKEGFLTGDEVDVDAFIAFSLSVQNRRKSRVGQALENHLESIFIANKLTYSRTPMTENKSKPDFIFPGLEMYRDPSFPENSLTMLGVKSTCKDRWRQVLDEADRIDRKHLFTLEAAISKNQTDAMKDRNLQLVVPAAIHESYKPDQQLWLYSVRDFLNEVKIKQK